MTSSSIPAEWLIPQKIPNQWLFECSVTLPDLVKTDRAASYFRQLVNFLECDNQIVDYHLKVRHNIERNNLLDILIYFGSPFRTTNPPVTSVCISCDLTHELSKASLISEQKYTRAWLDGNARSKLILTPIRHVERLSELNDENGEMEGFWNDIVELIQREIGELKEFYPTMVLNHGTYRHHPHLHLKIDFNDDIWDTMIAPRYQQKIQEINQVLEKPDTLNDCFGQTKVQKIALRQILRKK